jgi:hypothetical protein
MWRTTLPTPAPRSPTLAGMFPSLLSVLKVLHLPHVEGGFGVTFNDISMDAAFYTTT